MLSNVISLLCITYFSNIGFTHCHLLSSYFPLYTVTSLRRYNCDVVSFSEIRKNKKIINILRNIFYLYYILDSDGLSS